MQEESGDRNGYHKQLFAQETERLVELGIDRTARYSEAGGYLVAPQLLEPRQEEDLAAAFGKLLDAGAQGLGTLVMRLVEHTQLILQLAHAQFAERRATITVGNLPVTEGIAASVEHAAVEIRAQFAGGHAVTPLLPDADEDILHDILGHQVVDKATGKNNHPGRILLVDAVKAFEIISRRKKCTHISESQMAVKLPPAKGKDIKKIRI